MAVRWLSDGRPMAARRPSDGHPVFMGILVLSEKRILKMNTCFAFFYKLTKIPIKTGWPSDGRRGGHRVAIGRPSGGRQQTGSTAKTGCSPHGRVGRLSKPVGFATT